jgi:hypothetical protein
MFGYLLMSFQVVVLVQMQGVMVVLGIALHL